MADIITKYKVFIGSPNRLEGERRSLYEEISNYDEIHGPCMGVGFKVVSSDTIVPQYGRPQSIINEELHLCDFYILLLWDRWGTPPGETAYESGSEEEFMEACKCKKDKNFPMQDIAVLFKHLSANKIKNADEQTKKVLKFKEKLEEKKELFYRNYKNRTIFRKEIQKCLSNWANKHKKKIEKPEIQDVLKYWTPESDI